MSVYHFTVEEFIRALTSLKGILEKGKQFADERKIDFSVLLETRLAPDQFPLSAQIRIAADNAKNFVDRLSSLEIPKFPDTEKTYDEFQQRLDDTLAILKRVKPEDLSFEGKQIHFPFNPHQHILGETYAHHYVLPNFFFHVTTAYAILRSCGVPLGKADFLSGVEWISNNA
jgi:hypothetical protein